MAFLDFLQRANVLGQSDRMQDMVSQLPMAEPTSYDYPGFVPSFKGYTQEILKDPSVFPALAFAGLAHSGTVIPSVAQDLLRNFRINLLLREIEKMRRARLGQGFGIPAIQKRFLDYFEGLEERAEKEPFYPYIPAGETL